MPRWQDPRPRPRGVRRSPKRGGPSVAAEHRLERRAAVQAVDQDGGVGVLGPALAPARDEAPVIVPGRLRPNASDDPEHAFGHGLAGFWHSGAAGILPGRMPST